MNQTRKILIVEDEAFAMITLEHIIKRWGYTLCPSVASGEEALEVVNQEQPDVVLMDIGLAGKMDGIEAARQILSFSRAKIIFITGYSDVDMEEQAKKLSPLAYLIKPIDFNRLKSVLDLNGNGLISR